MPEQIPGEKKTPICAALLAHVDAGKTTLSEAMLYLSGAIRKLGRVDHRDAFLDTDALERERGITIFSKQAVLPLPEGELTLLDTPGHVDFSAEMERALAVLDCAVLVVSGTDGVQGHTLTLWRLLERYGVPTFLFVNKMDLAGTDRAALLAELQERLGDGCLDFGGDRETLFEGAATCDEDALTEYLDTGAMGEETLADLVGRRLLFPVRFGSALRLEGVEELLGDLARYCPRRRWPEKFAARVYKIARDSQGARLTYLKITGGTLRVKDLLTGEDEAGERWQEKADQLRIYSGAKFKAVEEAPAGTVCAVTGLTRTYPGQGLGGEAAAQPPALEPVLNYQLLLPQGVDPYTALGKLWALAEEDPTLHIIWNKRLQEIHLRLMGQVQLEVLQRVIADRFGMEVSFGTGSIVYKETIAEPVEGVGHYEPLRHYAEVRLLLKPGAPGSGLHFSSGCSTDDLDLNWQRLILTHLGEKQHLGVLTGSPITDMEIVLLAGRAHVKHTEGGDFRQATYRAVRQGLMSAQSILLEPWDDFRLEAPADCLGRAMADIQQMGGRFDPPQSMGELSVLTGSAPVSGLGEYWREVAAYTRGRGRLSCTLRGYAPCHNAQEVVERLAYDPERDVDNPADSVFCAHGAGITIPWREVPDHAHTESPLKKKAEEPIAPATVRVRDSGPTAWSREGDRELMAIFERTYGQVKPRAFQPARQPRPQAAPARREIAAAPQGPEYLLVDGYNIIFAWEELKAMARESLEAARRMLMDLLCNYQGFRKCQVILVFDAYKVKGNPGAVEKWNNIYVVYTKEAETADTYIERATYALAKERRVRVATSDNLEQLIILGHGAVRLSAREFKAEVEAAEGSIREIVQRSNRSGEKFNQLRHQAVVRDSGGE